MRCISTKASTATRGMPCTTWLRRPGKWWLSPAPFTVAKPPASFTCSSAWPQKCAGRILNRKPPASVACAAGIGSRPTASCSGLRLSCWMRTASRRPTAAPTCATKNCPAAARRCCPGCSTGRCFFPWAIWGSRCRSTPKFRSPYRWPRRRRCCTKTSRSSSKKS